jgi:thiol-disulfide isomerase/thioredoxin
MPARPRKSEARRQAEVKRKSREKLRKLVPWAVVASIVAVVGSAILYSQLFTDSLDSGEGFTVVAYQGEDEIGGEEINFQDLLSQGKPVVLNFWAGLCPPCRQEMPGFQRVYDDHRGEFILLGLDVGPFVNLGDQDDARAFLEDFGITYPTGGALTDEALREYDVLSMPTTVFLSEDGRVLAQHSGFLSEEQLRTQLGDLLAQTDDGGG